MYTIGPVAYRETVTAQATVIPPVSRLQPQGGIGDTPNSPAVELWVALGRVLVVTYPQPVSVVKVKGRALGSARSR